MPKRIGVSATGVAGASQGLCDDLPLHQEFQDGEDDYCGASAQRGTGLGQLMDSPSSQGIAPIAAPQPEFFALPTSEFRLPNEEIQFNGFVCPLQTRHGLAGVNFKPLNQHRIEQQSAPNLHQSVSHSTIIGRCAVRRNELWTTGKTRKNHRSSILSQTRTPKEAFKRSEMFREQVDGQFVAGAPLSQQASALQRELHAEDQQQAQETERKYSGKAAEKEESAVEKRTSKRAEHILSASKPAEEPEKSEYQKRLACLAKFGKNFYCASVKPRSGLRPIYIDGSNVAFR
ncbi:hypothetical protein YQE_05827, partial [Dendroctonus ponderosae]